MILCLKNAQEFKGINYEAPNNICNGVKPLCKFMQNFFRAQDKVTIAVHCRRIYKPVN